MKHCTLPVVIAILFAQAVSAQNVVKVQTCAELTQSFVNAQAPGTLIGVATPGEITGLTFNGVGLSPDPGSGWNVHGNTFENIPATVPGTITGCAVGGSGITDSHVDHNTFLNVANTGIFVYPGNNNTFDYNTFTNCNEAEHIMGAQNGGSITGIDASYNVITGVVRNGIEIQYTVNNLTVSHNWIGAFSAAPNVGNGAAHMALSIACGGSGTAPYPDQGTNITIADNTLLLSGVPGENATAGNNYALTAIEAMGAKINITGNYASGCGGFIMNGALGPIISNGNTIVGVNRVEGDNVPWPIAQPTGTDTLIAWNAPNPPPAPTAAQTTATPATTQPTTAPAPATQQAAAQPTLTHTISIYSDGSYQAH